jgi:galactokinase
VTASEDRNQARAVRAFRDQFGVHEQGVARAPGRVNLIGEHVDYNQGLVLPVAIDRFVDVAFAPRDDDLIRVWSEDFQQGASFPVRGLEQYANDGSWRDYVHAVPSALRQAGHSVGGASLAIAGDVPRGAGLASSAGLEVAIAGALSAACEIGLDAKTLATVAHSAESDFVGVQCGLMDQVAAALSQHSSATLIDLQTLECETISLPFSAADLEIVIADSGVRRALRESEYNQRRLECDQVLALIRQGSRDSPVSSFRDVTVETLEALRSSLPDILYRRAKHVVSEIERVRDAAASLRSGDTAAFGRLMCSSHESLCFDFEVSCPELDLLVRLAREAGALGSRMTGAGFGGCTVSILPRERLDDLQKTIAEKYLRETGYEAGLFVCHPCDGLRVLEGG